MSPAELTAWATVAIATFTGGVGFTTCFLVWHGIREMRKSSDERAQDRRAFSEADQRRHEEVMAELNAQNRRLDAQLAGFDAQNRRLDAQTRSLDAQTDALKALLLRIAPAAPAE